MLIKKTFQDKIIETTRPLTHMKVFLFILKRCVCLYVPVCMCICIKNSKNMNYWQWLPLGNDFRVTFEKIQTFCLHFLNHVLSLFHHKSTV